MTNRITQQRYINLLLFQKTAKPPLKPTLSMAKQFENPKEKCKETILFFSIFVSDRKTREGRKDLTTSPSVRNARG